MLSDVVRVVRMTRPLMLTSVFVGAPTDGHGNHQVAGQMAQEVFIAAGDPNDFPSRSAKGLRPWAPLKVYARVPFFAPTKDNTIYDYATDKYVPIRFYDYVDKTWIDETARDESADSGRKVRSNGWVDSICRLAARDGVFRRVAKWRRNDSAGKRVRSGVSPLRVARG